MVIQLACALLIIAGLFLLFGVKPTDITKVLFKPFIQRRRKKQRIRAITGKKPGFLTKQIEAATRMLEASGMREKSRKYAWNSFILALAGLLIGFILDNPLVSLVLACGLALLPLAFIWFRTGEYIRVLNAKLETAMGIVTNSYIQSGDILSAVEDNLRHLPAPLDTVFGRFIVEARLIDAHVEKALSNLRSGVDNRYWRDWCGILIQCQSDRQLRYALPGVVERLGETRRVQVEVDTAIHKQFGDYIVIVLIVLGSIPMMAFMMPDWYTMLMHTLPGKVTLAVVLSAVLGASLWVSRAHRPVE